jgi:hypothetical protein
VVLGPLANIASATTAGRPDSAAISAIRSASLNLLNAGLATGTASWAVYSPTNNSAALVANGWVDNEYDVIRSRGRKASVRNTF